MHDNARLDRQHYVKRLESDSEISLPKVKMCLKYLAQVADSGYNEYSSQ